MTYLLDTDHVVFLIRGLRAHARPELTERAKRVLGRGRTAKKEGHRLALSAVTLAELEFGARRSYDCAAERVTTQRFLAPFILLDFPAAEGPEHYGRIRHDLESAGTRIGDADLFIAAHALSLKATLVTNNRRDFSRVKGLACENWSEA